MRKFLGAGFLFFFGVLLYSDAWAGFDIESYYVFLNEEGYSAVWQEVPTDCDDEGNCDYEERYVVYEGEEECEEGSYCRQAADLVLDHSLMDDVVNMLSYDMYNNSPYEIWGVAVGLAFETANNLYYYDPETKNELIMGLRSGWEAAVLNAENFNNVMEDFGWTEVLNAGYSYNDLFFGYPAAIIYQVMPDVANPSPIEPWDDVYSEFVLPFGMGGFASPFVARLKDPNTGAGGIVLGETGYDTPLGPIDNNVVPEPSTVGLLLFGLAGLLGRRKS